MPTLASLFPIAALAVAGAVAAAPAALAAPPCAKPGCDRATAPRPSDRDLVKRVDGTPPVLNFGVEFTGPYVTPRIGPFVHVAPRTTPLRLIATAHDPESRVRRVQIHARVFLSCRNLRDGSTREFSRAEMLRDLVGDAYALRAYARIVFVDGPARTGLVCPKGWAGTLAGQRFVLHAVAINSWGVRVATQTLTVDMP